MKALGILRLRRWDGHFATDAGITGQEGTQGECHGLHVDPVCLGSTSPARHEEAGCIEDVRPNALGAQAGVNTIAPGLIATPMLLTMPQEIQDSLAASVPFPARFGEASEYADLALHIIGNVMLNGDVIRLDGALRLAPK